MSINCSCDDATGYRTLAQLRTDLLARLGFSDPMANIATRTLLQLRTDLMVRLGYGVQAAAPPPGMSDLLDSFVNEAQQTLFRRLELDKGTVSLPARMSANSDATTLDYMQVFNLALALAKSHYGKPDAKVYFEITEKYLSDQTRRRPPNIVAYLTGLLQDAQRQVITRYPALRMDRWFSWTLTTGERFYDLPDNLEGAALAAPANLVADTSLAGGSLDDGNHGYSYQITAINEAGETLPCPVIQTDPVLSNAGSVTLTWDAERNATGYRVYGRTYSGTLTLLAEVTTNSYFDDGSATPGTTQVPVANTTIECSKEIDPLQIKWVGLTYGNERYPLHRGIPPQVLDYDQTNSRPTHYEIKQCIELWPTPADDNAILRMRAGFKPTAFTADGDLPSIDDELLFLYALANAKAHFKQPDAQIVFSEFEVHLAGVVAGGHGNNRYVPGVNMEVDYVYVQPKPLVPFA